MEQNKSSKSNVKKRHWGIIAYPDSVPENWVELLQETGLPCEIGPLHDKDINPLDENEKKAHWHVIACWSGPASFSVAKRIADMLHAPAPKPLDSVRGAHRYLTHADHPDKFQYSEADIRSLNGFNIADFTSLTESEVDQILDKLEDLIEEQNILELWTFRRYLRQEGLSIEKRISRRYSHHINDLITSRRHYLENLHRSINPNTGEVMNNV